MNSSSRALQLCGLILGLALVVALGWPDEGFWFLGDAARHANTGLFVAELLRELPRDPVAFALAYYARSPVIVPLMYPPAFHLLEGLAFLVLPPTPWVAKGLVLGFAAMAAAYAMAWGRRWLAPQAGWAGLLLLLMPGVALYANGVLLNLPATALGLGALYHLRDGLETGRRSAWIAFAALSVAAVLTYYPAVLGIGVALAWTLAARRWRGARRLVLLLLVLLAVTGLLAASLPVHLARNLPAPGLLLAPERWLFYGQALQELAGLPLLVAALAGLAGASLQPAWRSEAGRLALGLGVILLCLVPLPARDVRYALLATPLLAWSALLLPLSLLPSVAARWQGPAISGGVLGLLLAALPGCLAVEVPVVMGFESAATYLAQQGPHDTVMYDGRHEAVFGFHLRAADPARQRRLVLAEQVFNRRSQDRDFTRRNQALAETPEEVRKAWRESSGARWVLVEIRDESKLSATSRDLRTVLAGPDFEHVASFPLRTPATIRLDLYRARTDPLPVWGVDVHFPAVSNRVYRAVVPLPKRP